MKINQDALTKTIKDGWKAGTRKCIFLYVKQDWSADMKKAKAKKSAKKGTICFGNDHHIFTGQEDPKVFYK